MAEKIVESDVDDSDEDDDSSSTSSSSSRNSKFDEKIGSDGEDDIDEDDDIGDDDDVFGEHDDDDDDDNENKMEIDSQVIDFSDNEDEDEDEDKHSKNHLQKFNDTLKQNVITEHHPELIVQNYHEVEEMCVVIRNEDGSINDPRHRTVPFITKYERAKILGERAKQINAGATPFVEVNQEVIDGYLIALAEFEQKKVPMIIRRPLPNGQSEYWKLEDLEFL
jgi:DNA-directed RNA polymerase I, II, and III subunit RPABC2